MCFLAHAFLNVPEGFYGGISSYICLWFMHSKMLPIKVLLPSRFAPDARLPAMIKFASLCRELVSCIKNGVMSHVTCTRAVQELYLLRPNLLTKLKNPGTFALLLSRSLRTLLCWYREYAKGKMQSILKKATEAEEATWGSNKPPPRMATPLRSYLVLDGLATPKNILSSCPANINLSLCQALLNSIVSTMVLSNADEVAGGFGPQIENEWVDEELQVNDDEVAEETCKLKKRKLSRKEQSNSCFLTWALNCFPSPDHWYFGRWMWHNFS